MRSAHEATVRITTLACYLVAMCLPSVGACQTRTAMYLQTNDDHYLSFFNETVRDLLPDHRLPRESDFRSYWSFFNSFVYRTRDDRDSTKAPFWTKGLFNDDDDGDFAFIVIDERAGAKKLFAILSASDGYRAVLLDDETDEEMGLATQQSGDVTVIAEEGAPAPEVPAVVRIRRHAIAFFHFEAASASRPVVLCGGQRGSCRTHMGPRLRWDSIHFRG